MQKLIFGIFGALLITGCASTSITPQIGNMFTVTQLSSNAEKAYNIAISRANDLCKQQGSSVKIIDKEITYQGLDKNQLTLADLADKVLPKDKTGTDLIQKDYNYKASLTFTCE